MVERKLYKTKLCVLYQKGRCSRQTCSFAHGDSELRRSFGSYNGFTISWGYCWACPGIVFTWRLVRTPGGPQRRQPKRQAPTNSTSIPSSQSNATLIPSGVISPLPEDLRAQNVVDEFFQPVKEEVLPPARKLGEKVLVSSAAKLKPYLLQAVKSSGISLDDYSKVVASICLEVLGAVEQNDVHVSNEQMADEHENKSAGPSADETTQVDQQDATEAASTEQVDLTNDKSPKSVVSNGMTQTEENDSLADADTLKKEE